MHNKTVCVIGLGYIGLPTALLISRYYKRVVGFDVDGQKIDMLNDAIAPFYEPGMETLLKNQIKAQSINFKKELVNADIYIVAVPTPIESAKIAHKQKVTADISYVEAAIENIINTCDNSPLVIIESTCPVGTTFNVGKRIRSSKAALSNTLVAYCPERVLPGNIFQELQNNDRVVGGIDEASSKLAKEFYGTITTGEISETGSDTAELIKLTENSYRDVNIAFANELDRICHELKINSHDVISIANKHPRVDILSPGPGVGGHCIAVDPWFLISQFNEITPLISCAREVNIKRTHWVIDEIEKEHSQMQNEQEIPIILYGLSYKPDVSDLREAPSVKIAKTLCKHGYKIFCVEPNLSEHKELNLISLVDGRAMVGLHVILVKHKEFRQIEPFTAHDNRLLDYCGVLLN